MRWPIRNQILIPFALIQVVAMVILTSLSAWISLQSVEKQVSSRLTHVTQIVEQAWYPLTSQVLTQLKSLTEAELLVIDSSGAVLESTMANSPRKIDVNAGTSISTIEGLPLIEIAGERYFLGRAIRSQNSSPREVLILYPENQWAMARQRAVLLPVACGSLILLLMLLTSLWIARRFSRRVLAVQQHVNRISSGQFQPVPDSTINDELRDLSHDVNQMAAALEESIRQIRENERMATLHQLAGGLAHNLRNALTGARMAVQLHQRSCDSDDQESIQVALTQLRRTEEQIRSLLRLSHGKLTPARPAPLNQVLEEVTALIEPLCRHHQVTFEFEQQNCEYEVSDGEGIAAALLNLLTNAIEATGSQGVVQFQAGRNNGCCCILVRDNGSGIAPESLPHLFTPFVTTKIEGVGIGLPVAKQTIEELGGTLTMNRVANWTEFQVRIPIAESGNKPSQQVLLQEQGSR